MWGTVLGKPATPVRLALLASNTGTLGTFGPVVGQVVGQVSQAVPWCRLPSADARDCTGEPSPVRKWHKSNIDSRLRAVLRTPGLTGLPAIFAQHPFKHP
jgi:hypothetical protein